MDAAMSDATRVNEAPKLREVDGIKVAFVSSESYFQGFHTPSMHSTAKSTGANMVILLAPGVDSDSVTDEQIRSMLGAELTEATDDD